MDRMYSIIESKSLDEEQRVISGWATTPAADRVGDVVDPFGVQSAKDIPLFLYHDSTKTVGRVVLGKATAKGIPFTASIPKINEPGLLKDRVDEAWQMVKHGLITAVSIGFRALNGEVERIKDGGLKFLKTEVLELSLVPVPAQSQAVITAVKSIDQELLATTIKSLDKALLAATGHKQDRVVRLLPPGVSGQPEARKGVVFLK